MKKLVHELRTRFRSIEKFCRLCLSSNKMVSQTWSPDGASPSLTEKHRPRLPITKKKLFPGPLDLFQLEHLVISYHITSLSENTILSLQFSFPKEYVR